MLQSFFRKCVLHKDADINTLTKTNKTMMIYKVKRREKVVSKENISQFIIIFVVSVKHKRSECVLGGINATYTWVIRVKLTITYSSALATETGLSFDLIVQVSLRLEVREVGL